MTSPVIALVAIFALVTASFAILVATIAPAAITSPVIAFTAILALVTANAAICKVAIVPVRSTVATAAVQAPFT